MWQPGTPRLIAPGSSIWVSLVANKHGEEWPTGYIHTSSAEAELTSRYTAQVWNSVSLSTPDRAGRRRWWHSRDWAWYVSCWSLAAVAVAAAIQILFGAR